MYHQESFTSQERDILSRFFTNTDRPVFALVNLPEVVKGALFARYSRSPKSVRRLFLDEFIQNPEVGIQAIADQGPAGDSLLKIQRAERLYDRVFTEYGDDSVSQLGGVHLACEQASNVLTKILERGRLAAYLEQSTRYIRYDRKLDGRYRYYVPEEIRGSSLEGPFTEAMDTLFETYSSLVERLTPHFASRFPQRSGDSDAVWRSSVRAKVYDTVRGLLPAATLSNVGIFATPQAYEAMLLRMRAHPLAESRLYADMMLDELRKTIPAFLRRIDRPDRGGAWSQYFEEVAQRLQAEADRVGGSVGDSPGVKLVEWDPDAEVKIAAAALYPYSDVPDEELLRRVRALSPEDVSRIFDAAVGKRGNRRHKPGRGFERVGYRFDLLTDFGIFRDLQRHRMLTVEWQRLGTGHGYVTPDVLDDVGGRSQWDRAMERASDLSGSLAETFGPDVAQYAVPLAFRIRYSMQLNAREAMHMLELRTAQGGHPAYRSVCQEMHRLIREQAGHRRIAAAMQYVDYADYELDRLESERRAEQRRLTARHNPESAPDS